LVQRALPKLRDGQLEFREQNESAATFCRKLMKDDGTLDFAKPAEMLAARINGLFPWPACSVEIAGQSIKFGLADATSESANSTSGTVLSADNEGLLIQTGTGVLRIRRLQRPGGKMLEANEFLRGFPIAAGTRLPSKPMTELVRR
jgi:methionyl-tRNA formyltransferase